MASDGWDQLTTARLILASLVAVAHSIGIFGHPFGLVSDDAMILFGHVAKFSVLAFFLISGLVIGRSLIKRSVLGDWMLPHFMMARFLRIYPPLLFSVALCAVLDVTLRYLGLNHYTGPATNLVRDSFSYLDSWQDIKSSLLSFGFRGGLTGSSNGPLWSLTLEMQAYVFVGLAAQIIVARSVSLKVVSAVALVYALRVRGLDGLNGYHFACFGCFAAGAGLSFLPLRFPKLLPVVTLDFSYSLYILHFPIILSPPQPAQRGLFLCQQGAFHGQNHCIFQETLGSV